MDFLNSLLNHLYASVNMPCRQVVTSFSTTCTTGCTSSLLEVLLQQIQHRKNVAPLSRSDSNDIENDDIDIDDDDDDDIDEHEKEDNQTNVNKDQSNTIVVPKIVDSILVSQRRLTMTSLQATECLALIWNLPGALSAGFIDCQVVTELVNVLQCWKSECCAVMGTNPPNHTTGSTGDACSSSSSSSLPVGGGKKRRAMTSTTESDETELNTVSKMTQQDTSNAEAVIHCQLHLVTRGLSVAYAVAQIPLQKEFFNWNDEAVNLILGCVATTILSTAQTLVSQKALAKSAQQVVDMATLALQRCLFTETVHDWCQHAAKKNNTEGVYNNNNNKNNNEDNAEVDELRNEIIRQRQDTVIVILRGLYPILTMSEILPNGENGKVEASTAASKVLMALIQEIKQDIRNYPYRWPKSMSAGTADNCNTNVAMSEPNVGISSTLAPSTPGTESDPSTPKTANKRRLRRSISSTDSFSMTTSTLTPKTKSTFGTTKHTNSKKITTSSDTCRPGPVFTPIVGMLQKLATADGLERATMRNKVVEIIHQCLCILPMSEQTYLLKFWIRLCYSKISVHRLVASELVGLVLFEDWLWRDHIVAQENTSQPLRTPIFPKSSLSPLIEDSILNMPLALFGALRGRLLDRAPTIRVTSAHAMTNICVRLLQTQYDMNIDPNYSANTCHVTMGIVAALAQDILGLLDIVRHVAINDEKATVRRACCAALVEILLVCASNNDIDYSIANSDIEIISRVCQDTSMMARRTAAEGITRLLEFIVENDDTNVILPTMEKAWTSSVLTMVLDPEMACVTKAVELVERLIFFPIVHGEAGIATSAERVAWRMIASFGDGGVHGTSRSEKEALRSCLEKSINISASNTYTTNIFRTIHRVAVATLTTDCIETMHDSTSEMEYQRVGVWSLFEAAMSYTTDQAEIQKVVKQSKIDLNFLGSSWNNLLEMYMSPRTPLQSKSALQRSMRMCLRVLSQLALAVDLSVTKSTFTGIQTIIANFTLPPEIIGAAITALTATSMACYRNESEESQRQRCASWIQSLLKDCERKIESCQINPVHNAAILARALFTVGELSLVGFSTSDDESMQIRREKENATTFALARGLHEKPSKLLVDYIKAFMTPFLPGCDDISTPDSIRAHAFIALGKLCLRDPKLAQQSLNILARELHQSTHEEVSQNSTKNWMVQSNCLLILGDLCVKYTNMVDRFLPVMAGCLQAGITNIGANFLVPDPSNGAALVRKHAVLLLSSLLLQDYIKWRGLLFHRFLVATVDEDDDVVALAEMVLYGPLTSKQPKLFFNHFVESLFVLNCCTAHPIYQAAAHMGDGGSGISVGFDGISLTGEAGHMRRLNMYQTMLSKMTDEEKIGVTARIGKEILGGALQSGNELNLVSTTAPEEFTSDAYESAYCVLRDALVLLSSPWIRVGKHSNSNDEDIEDSNFVASKMKRAIMAKGKLLSNISRKHLIEILLPVLCRLKIVLQKSCSPLLKDLMACIVDVYQRYKVEAEECLANDPTTLQEIQYDTTQYRKALRQKTPGKTRSFYAESVSLAT